MNDLINVASSKHKCKVISASSSQNQIVHPPSCILNEGKDNVWISGQGLPQEIIISLEEVEIPYLNITDVAFVCAHDYETNPKVIQIWVTKDKETAEQRQFVHWQTLQLKRKRGKQIFSISQIPQSERIIKILITETFGEFQTYLNQIMLLAQPDPQTSQSLFNQDQWNRIAQSPEIKFKKSKKNFGLPNKKILTSQNTQPNVMEHSPLELLNGEDKYEESEHQRNQKDLQIDEISDNRSFEKNVALLAMNKNITIMEDNLEELNRKVEILEKKVAYTYQNLQTNIMKRVQEMIDKRIQKQLSQKQLQYEMPKRLKSCKDLATSRTLNHGSKEKRLQNLLTVLHDKLQKREKILKKLDQRQKYQSKPRTQYYD